MTCVLITGGAGFIGSHLVRALLAAGRQVVVLDDLSAGKRGNLTGEERFLKGDVLDAATLDGALEGVDAVVHLAAVPSVHDYVQDWKATSRTNLAGTISVLDAATRRGLPVINASSCAVYGVSTEMPLKESQAVKPISGYGADKLCGEYHAGAMAAMLGTQAVSLRFFNVYGPRQTRNSPYSGVITQFLDCWTHGRAATVFGDGEQTRDFIYVGDIAAALMRAIDYAMSGGTGVFNVCTGKQTSLNALVAAVETATGASLQKAYAPAREGDIVLSYGDPGQASAVLGFDAQTPLTAGLAETVKWLATQPVVQETVTATPQAAGVPPD